MKRAFSGRTPGGFTLIELLIVVAIIAILAAIAVPNFLEAQVRSKVSRTRADMRTLATALEAYNVDKNRYPPDATNGGVKLLPRLVHLTTPVAYITSVIPDPWSDRVAEGVLGAAYANAYKDSGGQIMRPITFDYAKFDDFGSDQTPTGLAAWNNITSNIGSIRWAINSPGPLPEGWVFLGFSSLVLYDPTNGTVSRGSIMRTSVSPDDNPQA